MDGLAASTLPGLLLNHRDFTCRTMSCHPPGGKLGFLLPQRGAEAAHRRRCGLAHGDRRGRRIAAPPAPARRDSRSRAVGAEVDVHPASRCRVAFDWASDVGWGRFGAVAPRTRRRGGSVGPTGPADAESGAGNGPGGRPRAT